MLTANLRIAAAPLTCLECGEDEKVPRVPVFT